MILDAPVEYLAGRDSYDGPSTPVSFRTGTSAKPEFALVWLPGAGQRSDNELLRRLVNSFHEANIDLEVHGVSCIESIPNLEGKRLIIGGHSKGGGVACHATSSLPVAALIVVNAVRAQINPSVPALFIIGENDGGDRLLRGRGFSTPMN